MKAEILKSNPPQLSVEATGTTRTSGWTNPRLEPRIYIQPPADGIYVFDFVADRPDGISNPAITPISATNKVTSPQWAKGVRVVAETNSKQEKL